MGREGNSSLDRWGAEPAPVLYRRGTHRAMAPAATLEKVRSLQPLLGITRLAHLTDLDRIGLPVCMAVRPMARAVAVSLGKGLDRFEAAASALMESAETWHAERIMAPLRLACAGDMRVRFPIVEPATLPIRADAELSDDMPMLWIEGCELLGNRPTWLPHALVHTAYTLPLPQGSEVFDCSTNGLASGNHPLEALCHALCEVIERDATARWYRLGLAARQASRIELTAIADDDCREVVDRIARSGLALALWETTGPSTVPAFFAALIDEAGGGPPGIGSGCHAEPAIAALRALLEAAQVRLAYISGARDDLGREEYAAGALAMRTERLRRLMAGAPLGRGLAVADRRFADFRAMAEHLLGCLAAAGCGRVLAIDLTRPDTALPVMRVVVPGMLDEDDDRHRVATGHRR